MEKTMIFNSLFDFLFKFSDEYTFGKLLAVHQPLPIL